MPAQVVELKPELVCLHIIVEVDQLAQQAELTWSDLQRIRKGDILLEALAQTVDIKLRQVVALVPIDLTTTTIEEAVIRVEVRARTRRVEVEVQDLVVTHPVVALEAHDHRDAQVVDPVDQEEATNLKNED